MVFSTITAEVLYERYGTVTSTPSAACDQYYEKVKKEYICCQQLIKEGTPFTWWFPSLPELPGDKLTNREIMEFAIHYCGRLLQQHLCTQKMIDRIEILPDSCRDDAVLQKIKSTEIIPVARMHYFCDTNATVLKEFYRTGAHKCLRPNHNQSIVSQSSMCIVFTYDFDFSAEKFPPNCQRFRSLINCLENDWKVPCGVTGAGLLKGYLKATYESLHCKGYQTKPLSRPKSPRSHATKANDWSVVLTLILFIQLFI